MTFDAQPVARDTAVPMQFDTQPAAQPIAVPSPASLPTATAQPGPEQPSGSAPYHAPSIAAATQPHGLPAHLEQWAADVQRDLMDGGGRTTLGALLHKLGAPGLQTGVSPEAAQWMGSLPLGLSKAAQGAAETAQPGQRTQGLKDMGAGALQAATLPGAFVAPEAGEASVAGIDAAAGQAARAAGAVAHAAAKPFSTAAVQSDLQQGIRRVLNTLAEREGVTPAPSASIRDVAGSVGDAVLARSSEAYRALDEATGGRFQRFSDALKNVNTHLREVAGLNDEAEHSLLRRKGEIQQSMIQTFDEARRAGVDPHTVDTARRDWAMGSALHDLDTQVKLSTGGMRPELAPPGGGSPETVDTTKAFRRVNRMFDTGRLQTALGDGAAHLLQEIDAAFLREQKIADRLKLAKTVGKVTGTGAAVGAVGAGAKAAKDALGGP